MNELSTIGCVYGGGCSWAPSFLPYMDTYLGAHTWEPDLANLGVVFTFGREIRMANF